MAFRPGGGRILGQAHEHPARNPEIERQHVLVQDPGLALKPEKLGDRSLGIVFRQLDVDAGLQPQIPPPLTDQHARLDARLQFVHRIEQLDIFAHPRVRAFADDERQIGVTAVGDLVDRRPVGRDRADVSVLLPDGVGGALDDVDDDLVGVKLADARLFDQRIGFEPRLRLGHVEKRQRPAGVDACDRQDPGLAHMRRRRRP